MHTAIPMFSISWFVGTFFTILAIWAILRYLKTQNRTIQKKWELGFFIFVFGHLLAWQIYYLSFDKWTLGLSLPLHLCGISKILGGILVLRYHQYAFEFLILLGTGGALQSIITPEITETYNLLTHIEYYVSHGFIILSALYLLYVRNFKLSKYAWLHAFVIGLIVLSLVGFINHLTGGNYIYLCVKPIAENPLLIGPWPYYLLGFLGFGFVNIVLFHWLFRWWGKKIEAK